MTGVLVNTVAVLVGSLIGLLCKKGIPQKIADAIMTGIALCTLYIGISGALKGNNTIVLIISMVLGVAAGTLLDIDGALAKLGSKLEERFKKADGGVSVAQGFVTASLLFCVGAMTVVGSINAGLGDNEMLFTKSVLDLISAIMLSVSLGIGVLFSAAFVLVFQGLLALFAGVLAPVLSEAAIAELVCAGSVMIIALGLNMLKITKIKVADFLPALIFAPLITSLLQLFS
jgi:hypothetical protein